jgi:MFS family permease
VLALLGLPTFGLALAITVVTTYLPVLAQQFTASTAVIGVIIAAEGAVALVVPIAAGQWSDQLRTPLGGRLPFLVAAAPVLLVAIGLLGFVGSLVLLALLVFVFFVAYYAAYEPYRALYPDVLQAAVAGRGQSSQAIFRGVGTGLALVGGGLLFGVSPRLPFAVAGVVAFGAIAEFVWGMAGSQTARQTPGRQRTARQTVRRVIELLVESRELRAFLVANALWELSLASLKTFIVLFLTIGVGLRMGTTVAAIGAVAALVLVAAPVSGKLGDRVGKARVVTGALWVYGIGLLVPFMTQSFWVVLPALPLIAFGGGMILTLPYAILMPLMPEGEHGILTGFYSFSRGIGILLGPLLAGGAIAVLRNPLQTTGGYAAMWLVCSVSILASIPLMTPLRRREDRERGRRRRAASATSRPEEAAA